MTFLILNALQWKKSVQGSGIEEVSYGPASDCALTGSSGWTRRHQWATASTSWRISSRGKTEDREDRYTARFVGLTPPSRIVEAITFDAVDPAFEGVMIMEVTFTAENEGTNVSVFFKDIPAGIRPEDNEAGTQSSLEKLARSVE